ncbi:MAG TPA: GNAT family N-acetyltransferase [Polyangiaceae bacterium]|nr:GNAT family N-acetyltransferase [Polyangiaceae bacterium]
MSYESSELVVEALSAEHLPANVALSNSVGWPDTASEWQVIHGAALVMGVRRAGELIAQGALGLFEGTGSIAKMVVAPSAQRQGLGAKVLDALLIEAERRSLSRIGLVATPAGRRLYESRGFTPVADVAIVAGHATLEHEGQAESEPAASARVDAVEQLLALERRFTGQARNAVLGGRLREACDSALCATGFALATPQPGGVRIGPIFADREETARALTRQLLLRLRVPVRFDVPGAQRGFRDFLSGLGLLEKGLHLEMSRGGALPWQVPQRFGLATQAWG